MSTDVLEALAASGACIGAAESLSQWRMVLAAEIARHVPGATCTAYLAENGVAPGPPPPGTVVLPLSGGDPDRGYGVIALPPTAPGRALSLIRVLVQFAAVRLSVLRAGADQLALAGENHLLVSELEVLYNVSQHEQAPLHLHQLVARQLAQALTNLSGGAALLYDADTDDWQVVVELGNVPDTWPLPRTEQRLLLDVLRQTHEPVHHAFTVPAGGVLTLVPLLTDGRLMGAFGLFSADSPSLTARLPFINAVAGRAAILIYNRQLQLCAEQLLILEERNRIAREMHDGLAQTLAQLRNRCELIARLLPTDPVQAMQELDTVRAVLKNNIGEVVRVIHTLSPLTLEELGLAAALQKLTEDFAIQDRLHVELVVPLAVPALPPQIELTLFRVAQEALSNVTHEARADRCAVILQADDHYITLAVQDNARSHLPPGEPPLPRYFKMQKRIEEFGGRMTISPALDVGTLLTVTLPLSSPHLPQEG